MTNMPTWVRNTLNTWSCSIVAGNPNVVKADGELDRALEQRGMDLENLQKKLGKLA